MTNKTTFTATQKSNEKALAALSLSDLEAITAYVNRNLFKKTDYDRIALTVTRERKSYAEKKTKIQLASIGYGLKFSGLDNGLCIFISTRAYCILWTTNDKGENFFSPLKGNRGWTYDSDSTELIDKYATAGMEYIDKLGLKRANLAKAINDYKYKIAHRTIAALLQLEDSPSNKSEEDFAQWILDAIEAREDK